jgi:hypothetical protein
MRAKTRIVRPQPVEQAVARSQQRPGGSRHHRPNEKPRRQRPGGVEIGWIGGQQLSVAQARTQKALRDGQHHGGGGGQRQPGITLVLALDAPVMIQAQAGQDGGGNRAPQQQRGQGDVAQPFQHQQRREQARPRQGGE